MIDDFCRISIVNLVKSGSLYNEGMRPLMYSDIDAKESKIGWQRCGENIAYFKNDENAYVTFYISVFSVDDFHAMNFSCFK